VNKAAVPEQELAQVISPAKGWFAVYADLVKARLTLLVLLTTLVGFYVGWVGPMNYVLMFHALLGTALVASGAAALNQLLEREYDARMTPLGGLVPLTGMWLNNIFGGVGVGFINMLIFIIVTVFVSGMMIGRTPEFLGKKVEGKEMKLASLALLLHPLLILGRTAIACWVWATTPDPGTALAWLKNPGAHGFSEAGSLRADSATWMRFR
jgi:hypothetical protein